MAKGKKGKLIRKDNEYVEHNEQIINFRHFIILVAIVCIAYCNIFSNEFTYDDHLLIEKNPNIQTLNGILKITFKPISKAEWQQSEEAALRSWIYRPFSFFMFYIIGKIFSIKAIWYHLFSIIFQCLNTILVYVLCRFIKIDAGASLIAAGIFGVHPVHTEAVTSIMSMPEEFMFFFGMLGLIIFMSKIKFKFLYLFILYIFALFSKETAIILIALYFLFYLYNYLFLKIKLVRREEFLKVLVALGLPIIIYFAMRNHVTGAFLRNPKWYQSIVDNPLLTAKSSERILTSIYVYWKYFLLFFYPVNMCADYSFGSIKLISSVKDIRFISSAILLLIILMFFILMVYKKRLLSALGIAIFFISLLPVSNLLYTAGTVMAERYLYLPSLGLCLLVIDILGLSTSSLNSKRKIVIVVVWMLIFSLVPITILRNRVWKNDFELFSDVIKKAPYNVKALYNLASLYNAKKEYSATIPLYERIIEVYPSLYEANVSLIYAYYNTGRIKEAINAAERAINAIPSAEMLYDTLASLYLEMGMANEAKRAYIVGIKNIPNSPLLHYNLAILYFKDGDYKSAASYFANVLKYKEAADVHYYIGKCLYNLGDKDKALKEFIKSYGIANRNPDIYKHIVIISIELNLYDQASRVADEFIYYFPNNADAYAVKALLSYSVHKRFDLSNQYLEKALSINPKLCELTEYAQLCKVLR